MSSLDRVFELLGKERRRYVLYYLAQQDGPVSVNELAAYVAEQETDAAFPSVPDDQYERLEIELLHTDLPRSGDAAYIHYDRERRMIELTGPPPEFKALLELARVIERPDRKP